MSEAEVAQADIGERGEQGGGLAGEAGGFGGGARLFGAVMEEGNRGVHRQVEQVGDGFSMIVEIEGGGFVAAAGAVRAFDKEVGEELHFDFFEAVAGAAVAAAVAGVEREVTGGEGGGFRLIGFAEELADRVEGAEEHGGG